MQRRSNSAISSKFGIFYGIKGFILPPGEPPKGKEVLERLFEEIGFKNGVRVSVSAAARTVTSELISWWMLGDTGIPLLSKHMINTKILEFYGDFSYWINNLHIQKG